MLSSFVQNQRISNLYGLVGQGGAPTSSNLSDVLANGNNANNQNIQGVSTLDAATINATDINATNMVTSDISLNTINGQPYVPGGGNQNLAEVLAVGHDASGNAITNLQTLDVYEIKTTAGATQFRNNITLGLHDVDNVGTLTCRTLQYNTLVPPIPPAATPNLAEVLAVGNDASGNPIINVSHLTLTNNGYISGNDYTINANNDLTLYANHTMFINADNYIEVNSNYISINADVDLGNRPLTTTGDVTCGTLHYTALDPPIAPGATPGLAEVLVVSNDASGNAITNVDYISYINGIQLGDSTNYSNISSDNAGTLTLASSGAVVNEIVFSTDNVVINCPVSLQNNAINNVAQLRVNDSVYVTNQIACGSILTRGDVNCPLGDVTCNTLHYTALDPPIAPGATPGLAEVLVVSNDASGNAITNLLSESFSAGIDIAEKSGLASIISDNNGIVVCSGQFQFPDSAKTTFLVTSQIGANNGIGDVSFYNGINMNNHDIINVNDIQLNTINGSAYPPVVSTPGLADVLAVSNSANGLDMIDINNVLSATQIFSNGINISNINLTHTIKQEINGVIHTSPDDIDLNAGGKIHLNARVDVGSNDISNLSSLNYTDKINIQNVDNSVSISSGNNNDLYTFTQGDMLFQTFSGNLLLYSQNHCFLNAPLGVNVSNKLTSSTLSVYKAPKSSIGLMPGDIFSANGVLMIVPDYPLDQLSNSAKSQMLYPGTGPTFSSGAYSSRLLSSAYSGPVMNIRNGSTNVSADFYSNATGVLTTEPNGQGQTLAQFLYANSIAFITTLYDQTGNGNHASQSNSNKQPFFNTIYQWIDFTNGGFFNLSNGAYPFGNSAYTYVTKVGTLINTPDFYCPFGGGYNTQDTANGHFLCYSINEDNTTNASTAWCNTNASFTPSGVISNTMVMCETYPGTTSDDRQMWIDDVKQTLGVVPTIVRSQVNSYNYFGGLALDGDGTFKQYNGSAYYLYWTQQALDDADRKVLQDTTF